MGKSGESTAVQMPWFPHLSAYVWVFTGFPPIQPISSIILQIIRLRPECKQCYSVVCCPNPSGFSWIPYQKAIWSKAG